MNMLDSHTKNQNKCDIYFCGGKFVDVSFSVVPQLQVYLFVLVRRAQSIPYETAYIKHLILTYFPFHLLAIVDKINRLEMNESNSFYHYHQLILPASY